MNLDFKIIKIISHHNRGLLIITKYLGDRAEFEIEDGAMLGDIPVYHYKEVSPVIDNIKLFSFRPISPEWISPEHFTEGQQIVLTTKD